MPVTNPYYTFPPDAPTNAYDHYHNRSDRSPPPRPRLPSYRRRGLTHPLPDWVDSPFADPWAKTDPQTQCTLYTRIPPEIRFLIFEALLGNRVLHMYRHHVRKSCRQNDVKWATKFWDTENTGLPEVGFVDCQCAQGAGIGTSVGILRTCRRIYSDCISILYTRNTFNFGNINDILSVWAYPNEHPKRFRSIASIETKLTATRFASSTPTYISKFRYDECLSFFYPVSSLKVLRLFIEFLPPLNDPYDTQHQQHQQQEGQGGTLEEFWLTPIDNLVRHLGGSSLEEAEFVIAGSCFDILFSAVKEDEIVCNELRGGKRYRRRLEGVRPGLEYWISCPGEKTSAEN
ncbi:hypothetical protein AJ79_07065 [Helicocarpus griseus UAMH5409]|uniref:DUF7730 domain-containing protein n=1 Tax=Helicocarpus griseus UAMH5409 TaxID=1447875 RepID=A0A2B7X6K8_9EURO|nr:hypothetical protein AJ79_07065 [Helicocarpus griseus UAMH5409]